MTVAPERRTPLPPQLADASGAGAGSTASGVPADEAPKSKKKLIVIAALVVVVLLAGVVVKKEVLKTHYRAGEPVPAGQVFSLGSVTTSLSDGHLIQTTIELQLTVVANSKKVNTEQPQLLNAAIQTLGDQTYEGLLAPSGRTALKEELLQDFQQVLGTSDGAQQVDKVYLTSFVLQ